MQSPSLPEGKFGVIYADPPWEFAVWSNKGKGRSAERHYDCMSLYDVGCIPVPDLAAHDCALFLWVTDPMLPRAFDLMKVWGFQYKTVGFYWAKCSHDAFFCAVGAIDNAPHWPIGTGYWTRANPEQCLLAVRGKPKCLSHSVRKLIVSPRREHSRKPDEIYGRIEALVGGPYLELFARHRRPGWTSWGLELPEDSLVSSSTDDPRACPERNDQTVF